MLRKVINLKEGLKLTCGARARSVGAREVVGRGSDVGRWSGSAGSAGSDRRGGGVMRSRGEPDERSEHG